MLYTSKTPSPTVVLASGFWIAAGATWYHTQICTGLFIWPAEVVLEIATKHGSLLVARVGLAVRHPRGICELESGRDSKRSFRSDSCKARVSEQLVDTRVMLSPS